MGGCGEDADGDGLVDEYETWFGTDPDNVDSDGDRLTDLVEITEYLTSPVSADTDKDGYSDRAEVRRGGDPLDENVAPFALGDVNRDGRIDATDIQNVINVVLGLGSVLDCDINDNGAVNAVDVQLVINIVLGIYPPP